METSLFIQTLKTLIRDSPNEKKLEIYQAVLDELSKETREIEVIESLYDEDPCYSELTYEILKELEVNTDVKLYDHPYVIQIVKAIGSLAFRGGEDSDGNIDMSIKIKKLILPLHTSVRNIPKKSSMFGLETYLEEDTSNLLKYLNLKDSEEVSRVIRRGLARHNIRINPNKIKKWLSKHSVDNKIKYK